MLREEKRIGSPEEHTVVHDEFNSLGGTSQDAQDMSRMGKKQELRVSYEVSYIP